MFAKTPEQLMRSRYTAYALGGFGDYLCDTWYEPEQLGLTATQFSEKTLHGQQLEILDKSQQGNSAEVEFKATYLDDSNNLSCLHERSRFIRTDGKWLYVDGDIFSS